VKIQLLGIPNGIPRILLTGIFLYLSKRYINSSDYPGPDKAAEHPPLLGDFFVSGDFGFLLRGWLCTGAVVRLRRRL
jgi:hypothetical protein